MKKAAVAGVVATWTAPTIEALVVPVAALSNCPIATAVLYKSSTNNKLWHFFITNNNSATRISQISLSNTATLRVNAITNVSGPAFTSAPALPTTGAVTLTYSGANLALGATTHFTLTLNSNNPSFPNVVTLTIGTGTKTLSLVGASVEPAQETVTVC